MKVGEIVTYSIPQLVPRNGDFSIAVRCEGGEWQELDTLLVKVDMHDVREASMASFDFSGEVEVEITCHREEIKDVAIRPLSANIAAELVDPRKLRFKLSKPHKLSIEINGDRFHNLHLFAKEIEQKKPLPTDEGVAVVKPGIHRIEWIEEKMASGAHTIYFLPGMHHIEQVLLPITSNINVYIAGGAVIVGSLICDHVRNVNIFGRGIIYLSDFGRFSAFRGIRMMFSQNIKVSGIAIIDPPHYSIYMGQCSGVQIYDIESFSTRGWSDGIDMMACSRVIVDNVFMRNSDDCIAIYGHRWSYYGESRDIVVRNSVLWADVAHPTMIGIHGDHHNNGSLIDNICFDSIDILEHHEPQEQYRGCLTINAGDKNVVRNVSYSNIRIEPFQLGRVIDLRVVWNSDYNPHPGAEISNISYKNISYNGDASMTSWTRGYDEQRKIRNVVIEDMYVNGVKLESADSDLLEIGQFVENLQVK